MHSKHTSKSQSPKVKIYENFSPRSPLGPPPFFPPPPHHHYPLPLHCETKTKRLSEPSILLVSIWNGDVIISGISVFSSSRDSGEIGGKH